MTHLQPVSFHFLPLSDHSNSLILLSIPFLLLLRLYIKTKDKDKITGKDVLTVGSIILTVLFFIFQNTQNQIRKRSYILAANSFNCEIADSIVDLEKDLKNNNDLFSSFSLRTFLLQPHIDNSDILYKEAAFPKVLGGMQDINSLIKIVHDINLKGIEANTDKAVAINTISMYNTQIIDIAKSIKEVLDCK